MGGRRFSFYAELIREPGIRSGYFSLLALNKLVNLNEIPLPDWANLGINVGHPSLLYLVISSLRRSVFYDDRESPKECMVKKLHLLLQAGVDVNAPNVLRHRALDTSSI